MGLVVLMALLLPSKMSDWTGPGVHGAISTGRTRCIPDIWIRMFTGSNGRRLQFG